MNPPGRRERQRSVFVALSLYHRLAAFCAASERSTVEVTAEALRQYLDSHRPDPPAKKRRALSPDERQRTIVDSVLAYEGERVPLLPAPVPKMFGGAGEARTVSAKAPMGTSAASLKVDPGAKVPMGGVWSFG